mmetsp:Transcript_108187/g.349277  ORF Transcript_108187/g.349277 Transcript_108187/m.349277 type:complete len:243 (+) Transcript_108187:73-801(+)
MPLGRPPGYTLHSRGGTHRAGAPQATHPCDSATCHRALTWRFSSQRQSASAFHPSPSEAEPSLSVRVPKDMLAGVSNGKALAYCCHPPAQKLQRFMQVARCTVLVRHSSLTSSWRLSTCMRDLLSCWSIMASACTVPARWSTCIVSSRLASILACGACFWSLSLVLAVSAPFSPLLGAPSPPAAAPLATAAAIPVVSAISAVPAVAVAAAAAAAPAPPPLTAAPPGRRLRDPAHVLRTVEGV